MHFDAFVQKHSLESFTEVSSLPATTLPDTLHLSRLIPDQSIVSCKFLVLFKANSSVIETLVN